MLEEVMRQQRHKADEEKREMLERLDSLLKRCAELGEHKEAADGKTSRAMIELAAGQVELRHAAANQQKSERQLAALQKEKSALLALQATPDGNSS